VAPVCGYDLKRIFAAKPVIVYQPSSGATHAGLVAHGRRTGHGLA